jgi:hypothetical protein
VWQEIETQELGFVNANAVRAGMHVRAADGKGWNLVYNTSVKTSNLYRMYVGNEAIDVNAEHSVLMKDGSWKFVTDLVKGDIVKGIHGEDVVVKRVVDLGRGVYQSLQVQNHNYQLGRTVGHNASVTC